MHAHKELKSIVYACQNKGKAFGVSAKSRIRVYLLEGNCPDHWTTNAHGSTSRKYILSIKLVLGAVGMKPLSNYVKSSMYTIT